MPSKAFEEGKKERKKIEKANKHIWRIKHDKSSWLGIKQTGLAVLRSENRKKLFYYETIELFLNSITTQTSTLLSFELIQVLFLKIIYFQNLL